MMPSEQFSAKMEQDGNNRASDMKEKIWALLSKKRSGWLIFLLSLVLGAFLVLLEILLI